MLCSVVPAASAASEPYYYTIYLEPQGGVGVETQTYAYKGVWSGYRLLNMPDTPTMRGYIFEGWYDDIVGGNKVSTDYTFKGDSTIYAHWVPDPSVKLVSQDEPAEQKPTAFRLEDHIGEIVVVSVATVATVVVVLVASQAAS